MTDADRMVDMIRTRYPDLSPEEETAIRHHAETAETLFIRCKFPDSPIDKPLFSHGRQGLVVGEDFANYGTDERP